MKKTLYQYAVVFTPTEAQEKEGIKAEIIKDVTSVVAANEKAVTMSAVMSIPSEWQDRLDQIDVVVRAF